MDDSRFFVAQCVGIELLVLKKKVDYFLEDLLDVVECLYFEPTMDTFLVGMFQQKHPI